MVNFEADAIMNILSRCETGEWIFAASPVIEIELAKSPDAAKARRIRLLYAKAGERLAMNADIERRARQFQRQGMKIFDSLHVALA
jgi:hypothetical protein